MIDKLKRLFKKIDEEQKKSPEKSNLKQFNHRIRVDSDKMSDKEKMDKGFNGKTFTINGIEGDF